jgi:hypothetical protein
MEEARRYVGSDDEDGVIDIGYAWRLGFRLSLEEWAASRNLWRRCASLLRHPSYPVSWLTPIAYTRRREFAFVFESLRRAGAGPCAILDIRFDFSAA